MTSFGAGLGGSFWLGLVAIALFMMLTISMALVIAVGLGSLLPMMFLISMACGLTMTMLLDWGVFPLDSGELELPDRKIRVAARTPTDRMLTIAMTVGVRLELEEEFVFIWRLNGLLISLRSEQTFEVRDGAMGGQQLA